MDTSLPKGWNSSKVEVLAELVRGITYKKEQARNAYEQGYKPILRANNINGSLNFDSLVYVPEELIDSKQYIQKSDIVFAMSSGSKHLVGKSARAIADFDGSYGAFCGLVRPNKKVFAPFLFYSFQDNRFKHFIQQVSKGSNINNLKREHILEYLIFHPSIDEQKSIVAKIEELFSELDSGIASLKTAQEQLKIYRQALLKHAFEGKLTEQWRKDNADKLETPEQLLARIQTERETRYQQQLEEWKQAVKAWEEKGKEGRKLSKPAKPSKLQVVASVANLPWCFVNYEGVCELIRNGITAKPIGDSGAKIFRISAVRAMSFDLSDIRYINNKDGQYNEFFLKKGDLVFTRYNGTREYVGVCAEYKGDETHLYPDKLILTRLGVQSILSSFLEKAFATGISRNFIEEKIRTTAGQSGISGGDIKSTPIPICSLAEQQEIVSQLEEKLSIIEQNEKEIESALAKAELLRQSILKKAFSGQLLSSIQSL